MKLDLRNFNFKKFLKTNLWENWKYSKLNEAKDTTNKTVAAEYPGSYSSSRLPVLFDEEDRIFLNQFPLKFWNKALAWRYKTGLLKASYFRDIYVKNKGDLNKIREYLSNPRFLNPRDTHPALTNSQINYILKDCILSNKYDPNCIIPDKMTVTFSDNKSKYIFSNVNTGFKKLFDKLERPIKIKDTHKINIGDNYYLKDPNSDEELLDLKGPGLNQLKFSDSKGKIDKDKYEGGYYDFDLTDPARIPIEVIRNLDDDDPWITSKLTEVLNTPEKVKNNLIKNIKNLPASMAGFSTPNSDIISKNLKNWEIAMGLGLLGRPEYGNINDKQIKLTYFTKKQLEKELQERRSEDPEIDVNLYQRLISTVGKNDEYGAEIELKYPIYFKKINYKSILKDGENTSPTETQVKVPVIYMLPSKILPLLKGQQKEEFLEKYKKRYNKSDNTSVDKFRNLLDNIDLLLNNTELQQVQENPSINIANFETIKEYLNQEIKLIDLLNKKVKAEDVRSLNDDDFNNSKEGGIAQLKRDGSGKGEEYYSIGLNPGKLQKHSFALNMTKEQLQKNIEDYLNPRNQNSKIDLSNVNLYAGLPKGVDPNNEISCTNKGLVAEACRGVRKFIYDLSLQIKTGEPNKAGSIKNVDLVYEMMVSAFDQIVDAAAVVLLLNLNHPVGGVHDPENGLHVIYDELQSPEGQTLSQKYRIGIAYNFAKDVSQYSIGSYKSRRLRSSQKSNVDTELDNQTSSNRNIDSDTIEKRKFYGRRFTNYNQEKVDQVARAGWLTPQLNPELSQFLNNLRSEISEKIDRILGDDNALSNKLLSLEDTLEAIHAAQVDAYLEKYSEFTLINNREPTDKEIEGFKDEVLDNAKTLLVQQHGLEGEEYSNQLEVDFNVNFDKFFTKNTTYNYDGFIADISKFASSPQEKIKIVNYINRNIKSNNIAMNDIVKNKRENYLVTFDNNKFQKDIEEHGDGIDSELTEDYLREEYFYNEKEFSFIAIVNACKLYLTGNTLNPSIVNLFNILLINKETMQNILPELLKNIFPQVNDTEIIRMAFTIFKITLTPTAKYEPSKLQYKRLVNLNPNEIIKTFDGLRQYIFDFNNTDTIAKFQDKIISSLKYLRQYNLVYKEDLDALLMMLMNMPSNPKIKTTIATIISMKEKFDKKPQEEDIENEE